MSTVIFIRGYPGSGKSTYAEKLLKEHSLKYKIIDPEFVKVQTIISDNIDLKRFRYKINLKDCIESLHQGYSILWTQPWRNMSGLKLTIENINFLYNKPIKFKVLEIKSDPTVCWNRVKNKLSKYNFSSFIQKFVREHEKFTLKNIPYKVINQ